MTTRRQVLVVGALAALSTCFAYAQPRAPRIGILSGRPLETSVYGSALVRALAELGYRDGAGAILDYRSVDGFSERYPEQARNLVNSKCDVIFVIASDEATLRALLELRAAVPTVFLAEFDPVEKGIVSSLARPGGNMTGVWASQGLLLAKRLQILSEIVPNARRFLVLSDSWSREHLPAVRAAASTLKIELTIVQFEAQPYDLASGFAAGRNARVQGVVILNSPVFLGAMAQLSKLALENRLPSVASDFPGVLVGYYGSTERSSRQLAAIGDRILKGAKPAEIPVEQIDQFGLVINTKIAQALRIKIPESILARATRIVQ